MVHIPIDGHLLHVRLVHRKLQLMQSDHIRYLSHGKAVDLPEDLLQCAFVDRHPRRHQLLRHVHGGAVQGEPRHVQRLQHIHIRGDIGEQWTQGKGAPVVLDLEGHVFSHLNVHVPVYSGVQHQILGNLDLYFSSVFGQNFPAEGLARNKRTDLSAHISRLSRAWLRTRDVFRVGVPRK